MKIHYCIMKIVGGMVMNRKIIIGIIVVAIVILVALVFLNMNNSNNGIISKGYKLFGNEYCPMNNDFRYADSEHPMIAGDAVKDYKCQLCKKKYTHPNTATPKICSSCAEITGRCMYCGKFEK